MITAQPNAARMPHAVSAPAGAGATVDAIFDAICIGALGELIHDDSRGIDSEAVAAWHGRPENRAKLAQVLAAFEMQSQLLAARARIHVLAALLRVIEDPESKPETVRKACCDVLKMAPLPKPQKKNAADAAASDAEIASQTEQTIEHESNPPTASASAAATSAVKPADSKDASQTNGKPGAGAAAPQMAKSAMPPAATHGPHR